jgi:DNA-binding IscR family transcriptional regulator
MALLYLAANQGRGLVLLTDIAGRQEVSLPYVVHLIPPLIPASPVKSIGPAAGGVLPLWGS